MTTAGRNLTIPQSNPAFQTAKKSKKKQKEVLMSDMYLICNTSPDKTQQRSQKDIILAEHEKVSYIIITHLVYHL
mgnify:CR=1 FL=1